MARVLPWRGKWLLLLLLLACLLAACGRGDEPAARILGESGQLDQGTWIEPPRQLKDFTLTDQRGEPLSLSDLRGRMVLLFFGYTFCPDFCPMTMAEFAKVKQDLGDSATQVAFVMISIDGERDTPEVLARYLGAFDPDFIGLTGDERTLQRIGSDYGLYVQKQPAEAGSSNYLVDHSTASYLIDKAGQLRVVYSYGTPPDTISADIRRIIAE